MTLEHTSVANRILYNPSPVEPIPNLQFLSTTWKTVRPGYIVDQVQTYTCGKPLFVGFSWLGSWFHFQQ